MPNYKEMSCPKCGRSIRSTDKFCIFCGFRLQQSSQSTKTPKISEKERKDLNKELGSKNISNLNAKEEKDNADLSAFLVNEASQDDLDDRILSEKDIQKEKQKQKKKKDKNKKQEKSKEKAELPEEIKDQLEVKMNLAILNKKKERLKKKLSQLKEDIDSDRYEYDRDYAKEINTKFEAFKSIKEELGKEEDELRKDLGPTGQFRLDELEETMEVQRRQLIELKRAYKNHKIKRNVYEELKLEYSTIFRESEDGIHELRSNIIRWLSKEKAQKNRLESRIRLLEARLKTGEVLKEDFKPEKAKLEKDLENSVQRIRILDFYSKPRRNKFFD